MGKGTSYDPRMENLPVFISYPRSGSHWLNGIMELYFGRPRLRHGPASWFPDKNDYMWFHDHDIYSDLKIGHNRILYLIRDPRDVIFSILKAEHPQITEDLVDKQIELLKKHYVKYLHTPSNYICSYHKLKGNINKEFVQILKWLNHTKTDFNPNKLSQAVKAVSKTKVIQRAVDKRYFNDRMLTSVYERERAKFRSIFGDKICRVLNNKDYLNNWENLIDV